MLASTIQSEVQARFLTDAVKMLVRLNARSGLSRITAVRTVVGFSRGGAIMVPAPVDYVSWTQRIANFASRPDLKGSRKVALVTGQMSPIAKQHFQALGWTVACFGENADNSASGAVGRGPCGAGLKLPSGAIRR